jgi:hypothetical protein
MADTGPEDAEKRALLAFLDAQRAIVLAIVAGLAEDTLRTPVLASGWTPLGLVKHLGFAERHWFQRVAAGSASELPWAGLPGEEEGREPFTTGLPSTPDQEIPPLPGSCRRRGAYARRMTGSAAPEGLADGPVQGCRRAAMSAGRVQIAHSGNAGWLTRTGGTS